MGIICNITIAAAFTLFGASLAFADDVYITQCGSGTYGSAGVCSTTTEGSGASCSDAHSAAWFNSNATGGNTYHLCGTFTGAPGSTMLTPHSGSAGNPLVILFEQGTVLQAPYWGANGAIYINGMSYVTVDGDYTGTTPCGYIGPPGQGTEVACNGIIMNTANGTPAAGSSGNPCSDGWPGYSYQKASAGVVVTGTTTGIEIKNLQVKQIYMNDGSASCATDNTGVSTVDIQVLGAPTDVSVRNCELSDAGWGLIASGLSGGSGLSFYNNYIHAHDWHLGLGSSVVYNNIYVYNNEITDWTNWGYPSSTYHQDGIIVNPYQTTPGPTMTPFIYNNYIHGALVGGSPTAFIFCTYAPGCGTGIGAACQIFNNVLQMTVNSGSFIWLGGSASSNQNTGQHQVLNNTLIGTSYSSQCVWYGTDIIIENNIFSNMFYPAFQAGSDLALGSVLSVSDYNDFNLSNTKSSSPPAVFSTPTLTISPYTAGQYFSMSQWQGLGYDAHSITSNPNLGANFVPNSGSGLIGAGANLTSLCSTIPQLCYDAAGNARPSGAAWDIGAYQNAVSAPASVPAAPSNFRLVPPN